MKRIILSLLLTVIAVAGWGQFTIGKINYVVTGDNTCSVAAFMPARGEEIDFVVPSSVISNNNVQYTVEGINEKACFNAMMSGGYVKSITLPNTLRYIKEGAFAGSLIASIVIPEGVTTLGEYAFAHCPNLTSVTLPSTLTTIEKCENANFYGPNSTSIFAIEFINKSSLFTNTISAQLGIILLDAGDSNDEPDRIITIDKIRYALYDNSNTGWVVEAEQDLSGRIVIPSSVKYDNKDYSITTIRENAFAYKHYFVSVEIPSTVTYIGDFAFKECGALKEVTIKGQDIRFGSLPFDGCNLSKVRLYSLTPPNSYSYPFGNRMGFPNTTLNVPYISVNSYKSDSYWSKFGNVVADFEIPSPGIYTTNINKIKYVLFEHEKIGWVIGTESDIEGDIIIPSSIIYEHNNYAITTIMEKAFASTNISSAVVSEGITTIETGAFFGCPNLQSITLPATLNNVTFDNNATNGMSPIPSYIHKDNFINHSQINAEVDIWKLGINLYDEKTAEGFIICNHVLIGYDGPNTPGLSITIPEGVIALNPIFTWSNLETIVLPESVTEIRSGVFSSCNSLKNVTIKGQNVNIGDYAFERCPNIKNITLYAMTPPVANNLGILGQVYNNATLYVPDFCVEKYKRTSPWQGFGNYVGFELPGSHKVSADNINYILLDNEKIGWVIGANQNYQGGIVVPSSISYENQNYAIKKIDVAAFMFAKITSVVVSEGITAIGTYAFNNCQYLRSITLPSSLNELSREIAQSSKPYYIPTSKLINNSKFDNTEVANHLGFKLCDDVTDDGLLIVDHAVIEYIGDNEPGFSVNVPEGVTKINSNVFKGTNLTSITLSSTLETIEYAAFEQCHSLTSIVIPESVTTISEHAFNYCNSLTDLTIKGQNVKIGTFAFGYNTSLKNITMYSIIPPKAGYIFANSNCYINATLHVPNQSIDAYKAATEWYKFKNIVGFELNLKCAKPTYDAENGLCCGTPDVQYEIKSGYWIATSPEMPTDISLTIIAKKDGYIDSDPLLLSISKLDLNNDGKFDLNDLKYLQDKVLEK